ncbi:MAG: class II fructose-bisphosphate aldolase [Deltaproteobacteria bacterium]|nr:class II fructose-bisphosphate aldolase [Deltaproteobacteria bacterium]
MICESINELKDNIVGVLAIRDGDVVILDEKTLRDTVIDTMVFSAVFSVDADTIALARWLIRRCAAKLGAIPASIQGLYDAMGAQEVGGFTVPAVNIRTLTYDFSRAILETAREKNVGAVVFEIARSEIEYTKQSPDEYAVAILAGAIKAGFAGAIFLQGDHFQVSAKRYAQSASTELKEVKDLIWEALEAGFYNIDIDSSTLVDIGKDNLLEQQRENFTIAAELTLLVRDLEPEGICVSVGGEIGEVGGKNSTVAELQAFMDGYRKELDKHGTEIKGISKISVQTGTSHGGVPMPDGSIAKVKLDFDTLRDLSLASISEYGLAGAVQHGASTLPEEAFDKFPACQTAEVHLATGFQNKIYDGGHLPREIKAKIYEYLKKELASERKENDTEEQFIYKTRKKGFAPFKRELWCMDETLREGIRSDLKEQFSFLFEKLKVVGSYSLVEKYVRLVDVATMQPSAEK